LVFLALTFGQISGLQPRHGAPSLILVNAILISCYQNFQDIIQVFVTLLCASLVELGYNPNVKHCVYKTCRLDQDKNLPFTFVYKLGSKYYKTLHAIASYSSVYIASWATRVWLDIEAHSLLRLLLAGRLCGYLCM
jgi:hypothetical protein